MFVKNFNSIKRQTVFVDDNVKNYLMQNGYSPISKNGDKWIYISNDKILSLIEKFKGGDGQVG